MQEVTLDNDSRHANIHTYLHTRVIDTDVSHIVSPKTSKFVVTLVNYISIYCNTKLVLSSKHVDPSMLNKCFVWTKKSATFINCFKIKIQTLLHISKGKWTWKSHNRLGNFRQSLLCKMKSYLSIICWCMKIDYIYL